MRNDLEGEYHDPKKLRRSHLIIGLGPTGLKTFLALHRDIDKYVKKWSQQHALRFLYLDISRPSQDNADFEEWETIKKRRGPDIVCYDALLGATNEWSPADKRFNTWLDPTHVADVQSAKTTDNRLYTRLVYFLDFPTVTGELRKIFMATGMNPPPRVVVVGSLAEAAAGGIYIDLAYTIRQSLRDSGADEIALGVGGLFLLPAPTSKSALAFANTYGSLAELGVFLSPYTEFDIEYGPAPTQRIRLLGSPYAELYLLRAPEAIIESEFAKFLWKKFLLPPSSKGDERGQAPKDDSHELDSTLISTRSDLESLPDLGKYRNAYERLKATTHYPYRRDDERFVLRPQKLNSDRGTDDVRVLNKIEFGVGSLVLSDSPLLSMDVAAIICPRDSRLNIRKGSIYQTLLSSGGERIHSDASTEMGKQRKKALSLGDYVYTGGGELLVKNVVHFVVESSGAIIDQADMAKGLKSILRTAQQKKWKSIAIPWLGPEDFSSDYLNQYTANVYQAIGEFLKNGFPYPTKVIITVQNVEAITRFDRLIEADKRHYASAMSEERNRILSTYPFPIASAFRQVCYEQSWQRENEAINQALGVVDKTIRHLLWLALSQYFSTGAADNLQTDQIRKTLIRPQSEGTSRGLLVETIAALKKADPKQIFVPELLETRGALNTLAGLIRDRNIPAHHQGSLTDGVIEDLTGVLSDLNWLSSYPLVSPQAPGPIVSGIKSHVCLNLVGSDGQFSKAVVRCNLNLQKDGVVMLDKNRLRILGLSPFYRTGNCKGLTLDKASHPSLKNLSLCKAIHLFSLETLNVKNRTVKYIDVAPHELEDPGAYSALDEMFKGQGPPLYSEPEYLGFDREYEDFTGIVIPKL